MGEDERGSGLGGKSLQVDAVPGGNYGCEDAGRGAKSAGGVVSDAEAIAIMRTT